MAVGAIELYKKGIKKRLIVVVYSSFAIHPSNRFIILLQYDAFFSECVACIIVVLHYLIWNTKISNIKLIKESKLPKTVLSLIIAFIILIILGFIILGPSLIIEKIKTINVGTGRWNITVAENKSQNFQEWIDLVDAVIIAVPTNLHYSIAKDCLDKGKHVLIEKPLTKNLDEALSLFSIAQENQLALNVGHV